MSQDYYGANGQSITCNVKMNDYLSVLTFGWFEFMGIPRPLDAKTCQRIGDVLVNRGTWCQKYDSSTHRGYLEYLGLEWGNPEYLIEVGRFFQTCGGLIKAK